MTLEQFIEKMKIYWCQRLPDRGDEDFEDCSAMHDKVHDNYNTEFFSFTWTPELEQEVTSLWLQENSKLGKVLK